MPSTSAASSTATEGWRIAALVRDGARSAKAPIRRSTQHGDGSDGGGGSMSHAPVLPPRALPDEDRFLHPWQRLPFVAEDAVVFGPTAAAAAHASASIMRRRARMHGIADGDSGQGWAPPQWQGVAGGRRALLHGRRRAFLYSKCPRCTLVSCSGSQHQARRQWLCTGHCRRAGRLFDCGSNGRTAADSDCYVPEDERQDPRTLVPDSLPPYSSLTVTATAPFIGCANITGAPDGCPDAGTAGTLDGAGVKVLSSTCAQHLYTPRCPGKHPYYPFGHCQCTIQFEGDAGEEGTSRPCETGFLDWAGAGGHSDDAADVPVRVFTAVRRFPRPARNVTLTRFRDPDDIDNPHYFERHVVNTSDAMIMLELEYAFADTERAEFVRLVAPDAAAAHPGGGGGGAPTVAESRANNSTVSGRIRGFT